MEGVTVRGKFFAFDCVEINLYGGKLSAYELQPLLESFREGNFSKLKTLALVRSSVTDTPAAGSHSCAAGRKWNRIYRRRSDRRGAEGQQQPAASRSRKAFFFVFVFVFDS